MTEQTPNSTYVVELTKADVEILVQLIDAWIKGGGLSVVETALSLLTKVTRGSLVSGPRVDHGNMPCD